MQPNESLANDTFLHLADAKDGTDQKQDQLLALIEAAPQTEAEAVKIIGTIHHRHETACRKQRKTMVQLTWDPVAPQVEEKTGPIMSLLYRLPLEDQSLLSEHIIEGVSLRDIAKRLKVSKDTIRKRYDTAKRKLTALGEKR